MFDIIRYTKLDTALRTTVCLPDFKQGRGSWGWGPDPLKICMRGQSII